AVSRQVEYYLDEVAPGVEIKLTPLALTKEQVLAYNLPRVPIKKTDVRKDNFEGRRGEGAGELDALEALHPRELGRLVREALEPFRDESLEDRLADAHDEAQDVAQEASEKATAPHRKELDKIAREAAKISKPYREKFKQLDAELQAELAPLRVKVEAVRR